MSETEHKITVSERKFNGASTLEVYAPSKKLARNFARRFFREEYGHRPSKIDAFSTYDENTWTVMVADHSSGSLKESKTYEYTEPDDE